MPDKSSKKDFLLWCDSVERTFSPRENVPSRESPKMIPEQFFAVAIRYIRALACENESEGSDG